MSPAVTTKEIGVESNCVLGMGCGPQKRLNPWTPQTFQGFKFEKAKFYRRLRRLSTRLPQLG